MIILCSSKPFQSRAASMQLFGITKPIKKPKVDSIHEIKPKGFSGFISWRIIANLSKLRDHYAMQISKYVFMRWGNLSVDFITYHDYSINKLTLPSNVHHLNRFMIKQRETAMPYLQNGFFGSRHNVCPVAIAEIFVQTLGSITGNSFIRIQKLKLGCS